MSIRLLPLIIGLLAKTVTYAETKNSGNSQNQYENNVTGKVISADDHSGLAGVLIEEKGTLNKTITDIDGKYSIVLESENAILIISTTGYIKQEIKIGEKSVIDVILASDDGSNEELIMTALGIRRDRKTLGYDIVKVEGKDLTQVAQDNFLNSLAGKLAGMTINQTSGPGSTVSVLIRGYSSLGTDNQPLFIVDGIVMDNSLNNIVENGSRNQIDYGNAITDIHANDIENITVLKGPNAAALYGARAGNGVVIVTTKSGSTNKKMSVSVSSNTLFEQPYRYLDYHYKYANGTRNLSFDEGSPYWAGPELDAGIFAEQFGYDYPTELKSYPNNMKNFLQTGITSTNNVAVSGGNKISDFRVSYTNMSMKGMIPNNDRFSNSLKTNLSYDIIDKLKLNTNITISRTHSNGIPSIGDRYNNPLEAVYESSYIDVARMEDYWLPGLEGIQQRPFPHGDSPYFIANEIVNSFQRDRIYGSVSLTYDFTRNLSIMVRHVMDSYSEMRETKIPFGAARMPQGNYTIQDIFFQERNSDFLLTYKNKIGDRWDIDLSFGGNMMNQQGTNLKTGSGSDRRYGLVVPELFTLDNIPLNNLSIISNEFNSGINSLYSIATIGFNHQIYLDLTSRQDWLSTMPPGQNDSFSPSGSLSWIASNTFNLPKTIDLLKLRGAWASVDNYDRRGVEESTSLEFGIDLSILANRISFSGTQYTTNVDNQIFNRLPISSGYSGFFIDAGRIKSQGWEFSFGGTPIQNINGITWDIQFNFSRNRCTVEELAEDIGYIQIWNDEAGAISFLGDRIGDIYGYGYARVQDPNSEYFNWPIHLGSTWHFLGSPEDWVKVGNIYPNFILGMQTSINYGHFVLAASFDWRGGGEFVSNTYRYGASDWKSQQQLDQLIPGGLYSQEELEALLKSSPEEYIIPQVGKFPVVGGHTAETGGFLLFDGENDGAFVPGVIQTAGANTPEDFSDDVYIENLGGPGTIFVPLTTISPWRFNQNVTFDASFIKLRELSIGYKAPSLFSGANFAIYTRNLMLWNAANIGIDPERAFQANNGLQGDTSSQFKQGFERQNVMPWSYSIGFRMNFNF